MNFGIPMLLAEIQILLTPDEAPIPYGIAILVLAFFAFFCLVLLLVVKNETQRRSNNSNESGFDKSKRSAVSSK